MMSEAEKKWMLDLELLYDKWSREWMAHVHNNTHPTRENERVHLAELKKIITNHVGVDIVSFEGYLK